MIARCIREFRDLKAPGKPMRRFGDEWDVTPGRLESLMSSRYGRLAEAAPERPAERLSAPQKGVRRPTVGELEEMTVRQLVELCILEGVETQGRPRKAELLAALSEHYGLER